LISRNKMDKKMKPCATGVKPKVRAARGRFGPTRSTPIKVTDNTLSVMVGDMSSIMGDQLHEGDTTDTSVVEKMSKETEIKMMYNRYLQTTYMIVLAKNAMATKLEHGLKQLRQATCDNQLLRLEVQEYRELIITATAKLRDAEAMTKMDDISEKLVSGMDNLQTKLNTFSAVLDSILSFLPLEGVSVDNPDQLAAELQETERLCLELVEEMKQQAPALKDCSENSTRLSELMNQLNGALTRCTDLQNKVASLLLQDFCVRVDPMLKSD